MDTQTVPAPTDTEERAIYVKALRDLADFLEQTPAVPVVDHDSLGPWMLGLDRKLTVDDAAAIADALDAMVVKDGMYVRLQRAFGPITYKVTLYASDICEEREQLTTVTVLPEALQRRERF